MASAMTVLSGEAGIVGSCASLGEFRVMETTTTRVMSWLVAELGKSTSLTEKGEVVTGFGDAVNRHDILTGSRPNGTLAVPEPGKDTTCGNWTRSEGGSAMVGHHDRAGTNPDPVANASWNSSHGTRGCSVEQLKMSGSAGLKYC